MRLFIDEHQLISDREGNDGQWSAFNFRIGTPPQNTRLLIGLAGQETWVVSPNGCVGTDPINCQDLRGGTFNLNSSLTWVSTRTIWNNSGYYKLSNQIGDSLGIDSSGEYGFDTVRLGWDFSALAVNRTIISSFTAKDYFLGQFGISPRPTNFTVTNDNSSALDDPVSMLLK
jgi:hypothetical protein